MQKEGEAKDHLLLHPPTLMEMEIAYYRIVDGWTRAEIVKYLCRSPKTIDVHTTRFRNKCRVHKPGWYDMVSRFWWEAGIRSLAPPDD